MSATQTLRQHISGLATNLPSGKVWTPKWRPESNLYKLLSGLAPSFVDMDASLQGFIDQSIPTTTTAYLEEWEDALGLPDECLPIGADTAERQRNIDIKLATLGGVSTEADFVALALLFGLVVTVNSGIEHVVASGGTETPALTIPADFANVAEARMTMVVREEVPASRSFTYTYPIKFSLAAQNEMRCLFTKLKPANVAILFVTAP